VSEIDVQPFFIETDNHFPPTSSGDSNTLSAVRLLTVSPRTQHDNASLPKSIKGIS
jgi:hypothetical protein